jgi:hypothetical protein
LLVSATSTEPPQPHNHHNHNCHRVKGSLVVASKMQNSFVTFLHSLLLIFSCKILSINIYRATVIDYSTFYKKKVTQTEKEIRVDDKEQHPAFVLDEYVECVVVL